ncbi:MAG TPA: hypothetical protein VLB44_10780, partial [Kofleriaceae bacterium]|nr:hypothetical protein [Kofleriaceae bacterium]
YTYIQPFGLLTAPSTSDLGNDLTIIAGVNFGGEAFITDWLSLRAQIGGAVSAAQKFDVINVASTTGLFGTVYWK